LRSGTADWFAPLFASIIYNFQIFEGIDPQGAEWVSAVEWYQLDPALEAYSTVAGGVANPDLPLHGTGQVAAGQYYTGLTRDDVGGLRYLLSRSNRVWEPLLPGVSAAGQNASNLVNLALRGGVEKLTFVRLSLDEHTHQFQAITNRFFDVYYTNGMAVTQSVQRVVLHPDLLLATDNLDVGFQHSEWGDHYHPCIVERSGIPQWQNNSSINQRAGAGRPGIIQPGARITFNRLGRLAFGADREYLQFAPFLTQWASFSGPDSPVVPHFGPLPAGDQFYLGSRITIIDGVRSLQSAFHGEYRRNYRIDVSTNVVDWKTWYWRENREGIFNVDHPIDGQNQFLRVTREPWPW
jgi:hypothetical protein